MVVPPLERNHFIKGDDDDDEALFSDGEGKDATESSSSSHQIPHKQASTSWEIDVHPPRRTASTRYKVRLAKSNDQHLAKTLPPLLSLRSKVTTNIGCVIIICTLTLFSSHMYITGESS